MKYEIFYSKNDNSYCLISDDKSEKEKSFLTQDSEKITEFSADKIEQARIKYDQVIDEHQNKLAQPKHKKFK